MWESVGELVAAGTTIVLTTQYLEEADRLADRIALIDGGRVVASGTPDELKATVGSERLELTFADAATVADAVRVLGPSAVPGPAEPRLDLPTDGSAAHLHHVLDELARAGRGGDYVDYVVPGIILLCAGFGAAATATAVATDMTGGMVDRLRSLPIRSSAVLTGHVVASVARNALATAVVVVAAVAMGFRPDAGPVEWLLAAGLLLLYVLALSWLAAFLGVLAGSVEAANALSFAMLFLPYLSSAFVPTGTMPGVLRAIADHQPITPVIETTRGLLTGTAIGSSGLLAVLWCLGLLAVSVTAAAWAFRRRTSS